MVAVAVEDSAKAGNLGFNQDKVTAVINSRETLFSLFKAIWFKRELR